MAQNRTPKINFWQWLQSKYCLPEFGGWMMLGLAVFFFISATNTLTGWLYVISGVSFALLLIGSVMPARLLQKISVKRSLIEPISAGENLWVEVILTNQSSSAVDLLWVRDGEPLNQSQLDSQSWQKNQNPHSWQFDQIFERLEPGKPESFSYQITISERGYYQFGQLQLLTSSPLGLCRSLRFRDGKQNVIVYPQVLPLTQCPLIDFIGQDQHQKLYSLNRDPRNANEGITKTIRPYRWGDSIRLVHWRSSAKFGELRVRDLEVNLGGQEVAIAIDLNANWQPQQFEQAVIAAASLYFYAQRTNLTVKLWNVNDGMIEGERAVLESLAVIYPNQFKLDNSFPTIPIVWLTSQSINSDSLPSGSRTIIWTDGMAGNLTTISDRNGLTIGSLDPDLSQLEQLNQLQLALQSVL